MGDNADPLYVAQGHSLHGPSRDGTRWRRTIIAERNGQIVGAATAARNRVHPDRYVCAIEVAPALRRRGIAIMLLEEIRQIIPEQLPLAGKIRPFDAAATALLAAAGGTIYQRCPGVRPNPASAAIQAWCADQITPDDVTFMSMSHAAEAAQIEAWVTSYLWTHASWAPADPQVLRERSRDILADVDLSLSIWATRDGEPCAAAWVFTDVPDAVIVVTETVRPDEPDGTALIAGTLGACLRTLAAAGINDVLIDGHETDPHLAPVIATLPATASDPLLLVEVR